MASAHQQQQQEGSGRGAPKPLVSLLPSRPSRVHPRARSVPLCPLQLGQRAVHARAVLDHHQQPVAWVCQQQRVFKGVASKHQQVCSIALAHLERVGVCACGGGWVGEEEGRGGECKGAALGS